MSSQSRFLFRPSESNIIQQIDPILQELPILIFFPLRRNPPAQSQARRCNTVVIWYIAILAFTLIRRQFIVSFFPFSRV